MRISTLLIALLTLSPFLIADDSTSDQTERERTRRLNAWRASEQGQAALKEITAIDSRLQLRLVLDKDAPGQFDEVADPSSGGKLRITREVLLNEKAFSSASVVTDDKGGAAARVRATLTDAGANQMEWVTSRNINHRLAILFDGKLLMAPSIRSTIRQSLEINGGAGLSKAEGEKLVAAIQGNK
ncbi:MAG TPA: hypothetical protein VH475_25235 [Tepidisphaeraceae bacterium]|jgi:preprotein translocase subunit SecD